MIQKLREQYIACCQAYADILLKLFGAAWEDARWEHGRIGSRLTFCANGETFTLPMDDIAYIIDNDVTVEEIHEWTEYNSRANDLSLFFVDIEAWHDKCERIEDADMDLLAELHDEISSAVEKNGKGSPEEENARTKFTITKERILNRLHIFSSIVNS